MRSYASWSRGENEQLPLVPGVAGCCWHGDTPYGNKQALVGHHLESGWLFSGRSTHHGDLGPFEPIGQLPHWKTSPPSAPADGFLCVAGNHSFTVQWKFGTANCRTQL
ncbi:hypothetical protein AVEN_204882-1 [Araneus ventricosus]|uniref:Uncharacterized protein n=1 Tax=Araneus ventricosus TaxID=182803 RepID=A0A4Y2X0A2_ARAVE|nr:hypothetical protein AVEN_204882-1 [Araneus ventricosus]